MDLWQNINVSRFKPLLLFVILLWIIFTYVDFHTTEIRTAHPFPAENFAFYKERQLLVSNILENESLISSSQNSTVEEDYSADYTDKDESSDSQEASVSPSLTFEPITEEYGDIDEEQFKAWLKQKHDLSQNVDRVCRKYGHSLRKRVSMKEFMYDSEHDLLFCRNAKVGTTSWLSNFLLISSKYQHLFSKIQSSKKLHVQVPKLFRVPELRSSERRDLFEKSVSFSIVRHPFERLVSAFQDKIVDQSDGWYANRVQYLKVEYGGVSFANFAEMVLDKSVKVCRQMNTCKLDKHWKPFISRCGYCDIPYTVIARAENIAEDQKYIGHMANVTFHKIESHVSSGGSTKDLARKYFSEMDIDTVKRLYQLYKVDFEMFGYSPDEYFKLARKS